MSVSSRDVLLGLLVMLGWAGNTVVIKFITLEVEPFTGLALRFVIAALVFLPFLRMVGRAQFWVLLQICVCMAVLHWGSLIWAIDRLDASMAAILMQMQVIFAALIGRFFFGENFGWRTGAGIMLGIAGVAVLVGLPEETPSMSGVLGMVFSMFTIVIAYARMKAIAGVSSVNYMAHLYAIGIVPVIVMAFMFEAPLAFDWGAVDWRVLGRALLYQVFLVSGVHMLWQRLMGRNAMSGLPNLTLLLPVMGVAMAVVFLGERVSMPMVFGGVLTMIGVGIVLWRKRVRAVQ
ncbi:MAG: DMT family transporter [Alphaproteobacteria bacterium]